VLATSRPEAVREVVKLLLVDGFETVLRQEDAATTFAATPANLWGTLGTGNGEVDRSTRFAARSDDVVPVAMELVALDLQLSQFLL